MSWTAGQQTMLSRSLTQSKRRSCLPFSECFLSVSIQKGSVQRLKNWLFNCGHSVLESSGFFHSKCWSGKMRSMSCNHPWQLNQVSKKISGRHDELCHQLGAQWILTYGNGQRPDGSPVLLCLYSQNTYVTYCFTMFHE